MAKIGRRALLVGMLASPLLAAGPLGPAAAVADSEAPLALAVEALAPVLFPGMPLMATWTLTVDCEVFLPRAAAEFAFNASSSHPDIFVREAPFTYAAERAPLECPVGATEELEGRIHVEAKPGLSGHDVHTLELSVSTAMPDGSPRRATAAIEVTVGVMGGIAAFPETIRLSGRAGAEMADSVLVRNVGNAAVRLDASVVSFGSFDFAPADLGLEMVGSPLLQPGERQNVTFRAVAPGAPPRSMYESEISVWIALGAVDPPTGRSVGGVAVTGDIEIQWKEDVYGIPGFPTVIAAVALLTALFGGAWAAAPPAKRD